MNHLTPERHPQQDFFIADIMDAAPKSDLMSMEHPIFALKAGDRKIRRYERNGVSIEIQPGAKGLATIHDKDIWIYCISQLIEAMNRGREIDRVVQFVAYDFLVTTNRRTGGDSYNRMGEALARLKGTTVITNIETSEKRERAGFGLIDSWRVIERKDNRMVAIEVELPRWLFRAIESKQVLTLNRDYFRLRKPLDRRIYELARKHCGAQPKWVISLSILHEKSGSASLLKKFRVNIKGLAESNDLPDYRITFDSKTDSLTFYNRGGKGNLTQIKDTFKKAKLDTLVQEP
jgi:plasmid replication initiation protein